ncbi:MAG: LON peptidase substrate-binding domain-containing protein [Proteobacteria bacterium]|nr:LON peptidase substrate-binding domain-containing protein [Pseudomonadota bacterium]
MPAPPSPALLPLFPLGTVLFPDGLLLLRIFELRYLDMIGKCHKAGAPFGVVCLTEGAEVRRPEVVEAFCEVGTLARIDTLETTQPGLLHIRCTGAQRFRIERSERLKNGLWIAEVEPLPPDLPVTIPTDLRRAADALARLLQTLQDGGDPRVSPPPWRLDDCGWVANRWAELLPLTAAPRQRLMALDNPLLRLELVDDLLGSRAGES